MTPQQFTELKRDLEIVLAKIEANPRCYDQDNICRTACCIAGHLYALRIGPPFLGSISAVCGIYGIEYPWIFGTAYSVNLAMWGHGHAGFATTASTIRQAVNVWLETDALQYLEAA